MSRENVEIVRRAYDALNRRDLEATREFTHPNAVFRTTVETFRGHDGLTEWVRKVDEILEGYRLTVDEIIDAGDRVLAFTHQSARGKGSGIEIEHHVAHVWTIQDGRVTAFQAFTDRSEALEAVGLRE